MKTGKKINGYIIRSAAVAVLLSSALIAFTSAVNLAARMPRAHAQNNTSPTAPILGNYPDTTLALSDNTTVTPDAPPINTTRITVSTSTSFNGTLEGYPTTGVVRVT